MIQKLKNLFSIPPGDAQERSERIEVATCVLLLEMAHADDTLAEVEERLIEKLMRQQFDLSAESTGELMELARAEQEKSVDLYRYGRQIHENLTREEKQDVLRNLWRVIFADGVMDMYEESLARQMTALLRLTHREMIDAKIAVQKERGKSQKTQR